MATVALAAALAVLAGPACSSGGGDGNVTPDANDQSAPDLRIGTAGLPRDLLVVSGGTSQRGRARHANGDVLIGATAQDDQSGIREVSLDGESRVICVTGDVGQMRRGHIRISNPHTGDAASVPTTRRAFFTARFSELHDCPAGSSFVSFEVELRATATNFAGRMTVTPNAVVYHSGPDALRVATLNIFSPGLRALSLADRAAALNHYGELIRQADIAVLQELAEASWLPSIAQAAGMPHYSARPTGDPDVAILSRYPLDDLHDYSFAGGAIYAATAQVDGIGHRIFALHWKHRPEPWLDDPDRLAAAQRVRDLGAAENFAIAAGDLNVCAASSAANENECEGKEAPGTEVRVLGEALVDAFSKAPSATHCSNKRIDVVFVRGYNVDSYDACQNAHPSDHPFVLVHLSAPPGGPP